MEISRNEYNRARRCASRYGYSVTKARGKQHTNNHGGLMMVDRNNCVVAGANYEMNADDVVWFIHNVILRQPQTPRVIPMPDEVKH